MGALAMISRHAFSTHIAKGRRDSSDFKALTDLDSLFPHRIPGRLQYAYSSTCLPPQKQKSAPCSSIRY